MAGTLCCCCCIPLLLSTGILTAVLLLPGVSDTLGTAVQNAAPSPWFFLAGAAALSFRDFVYCFALEVKSTGLQAFTPDGFKSVYLGCLKTEITLHLATAQGWDRGVALAPLGLASHTSGTWGPVYFSHAGYKAAVYNPQAGRPSGMFLFSNTSKLPPGVMPEGVEQVLLEYDTGAPEWTARRRLMADALVALHADQPQLEAVAPQGVSPRQGGDEKSVMRVLGVTLFKWLFDVDVADEIESIIEYDKLFAPVVFGQFSGAKTATRLAAIRASLLPKIAEGSVGKRVLALAEERGMDGQARLREFIWVVLFAAFGGTSNLATQTLRHILRDPAVHVATFRRDPDAFMLEAARMYPPVGGMNPMELREPVELQTPSGAKLTAGPGTWAMAITTGANLDPNVFEEPEAWRPGRAHADRLMTWNAELRDIRAGTAPRGCPGTHLALRLATAVVSYFVAGIEETLAPRKGEL